MGGHASACACERILMTLSQQMAAHRLKKSREWPWLKRRNNRSKRARVEKSEKVEESEKKLKSAGGKNFRGAAG